MAIASAPYPVEFSVDYADTTRNRLTVAFRLILAIPILIVLTALTDWAFGSGNSDASGSFRLGAGIGGVLFFATMLMLVFRRKYPGWWFDWNRNLLAFKNRVFAYLLLLRDEYPSTDDEQAVHLVLPDPAGGQDLNRWLPLVKWLLVVPHMIVLLLLAPVVIILTLAGWFVVLVTGRFPRPIHDFVVGTLRWALRVEAYAFVLVTDRYPPFRLSS